MLNQQYREFLISNILEWQNNDKFNLEDLAKMSIRELEIIFDNI